MPTVRERERVQTTLRLPKRLMAEVKDLVEQRQVPETGVNELMVAALQKFVDDVRDRILADAFAEMGRDEDYLRESRIIEQQFARADAEVLPKE